MPISMRKKDKAAKIASSILGTPQNEPKKKKKKKKEAALAFEETRRV